MTITDGLSPASVVDDRATDTPADRSPFALGMVLRRAHRRAVDTAAQVLRPVGLELRHFAVLMALHAHGPLSQNRLVEITGTDKASMVRTVDDLERHGLVERHAVPGDRRVREVVMTEAGLSTFDEAHLRATPALGALVSHITPAEHETLLALLTRFAHPDAD